MFVRLLCRFDSGCKQRELHHSLGIDLAANARGRAGATGKSAVCVLQ